MNNVKEQFKADLKEANTLNDVFNACNKNYDCNTKLGTISKALILMNIDKLISGSGVKPKK